MALTCDVWLVVRKWILLILNYWKRSSVFRVLMESYESTVTTCLHMAKDGFIVPDGVVAFACCSRKLGSHDLAEHTNLLLHLETFPLYQFSVWFVTTLIPRRRVSVVIGTEGRKTSYESPIKLTNLTASVVFYRRPFQLLTQDCQELNLISRFMKKEYFWHDFFASFDLLMCQNTKGENWNVITGQLMFRNGNAGVGVNGIWFKAKDFHAWSCKLIVMWLAEGNH